jgi:hypothetical protein
MIGTSQRRPISAAENHSLNELAAAKNRSSAVLRFSTFAGRKSN